VVASNPLLWFRWSLRDLRHRWAAVVTIAIVIGIGIGVYTGLGSSSEWRRQSNDASFADREMHDIRIALNLGTTVDARTLRSTILGIADSQQITAITERLIIDSQVDASTDGKIVLVPAQIVGSSYGTEGTVDDVWVTSGSLPSPGDTRPQVLIESKFADFYGLPTTGTILISGGTPIEFTGHGVAPDEFFVTGTQGALFAQADYVTLYTDIATAQDLAGLPGQVNDAAITIADRADVESIRTQLETTLNATAETGATVTTRDESPAYRVLYDDIGSDQQIWDLLSGLVLAAAALAAFNLISRVVHAQRREIGIGMALGLPRPRLAIRPLLVGVQVAVLGSVFGLAAGAVIGVLLRNSLDSILPLPVYLTPFQPGLFAKGVLLAFAVPLLASIVPVWRAIRVEPIMAIRTGHMASGSGRIGSWAANVRLPGSSISQLPIRNLLRAPRHTLLTAGGIGAAIAALVAILGIMDSFILTIDRGAAEATRGSPERVSVTLDSYYPESSPVIAEIRSNPAVGTADPSLILPAAARTATTGGEIDLVVELFDLEEAQWSPTISRVASDGVGSGIILAEKAAADLEVEPGDTLMLRHPLLTQEGTTMAETEFIVAALHPSPVRSFAYLDTSWADSFGLSDFANGFQILPAPGFDRTDVQRAMFAIPGVAAAQPVSRIGESFDEALAQVIGFLYVTEIAVFLLAVLIAFNSTRISIEERRRDNATMLAFGLKPRTVIGLAIREAMTIGVLATIIGVAAGLLAETWLIDSFSQKTLPEFDIVVDLSGTSIVIALIVGVVAAGLSPLFLARKVRRMNLPDTLRLVE
jgi:putative ABC transport system permease protein